MAAQAIERTVWQGDDKKERTPAAAPIAKTPNTDVSAPKPLRIG